MLEDILRIKREKNWGSRKLRDHFNISRYKCDQIITWLRLHGESFFKNKTMEDLFPGEGRVGQTKDASTQSSVPNEMGSLRKNVELERTLVRRNSEFEDLKKKYSFVVDQLEKIQSLREVAVTLEQKTTRKPTVIKSSGGSKSTSAVPFLIASDWHVEEDVDPSTVNDFNTYNPTIAKKRAEAFFRNGVFLIKHFQSIHNIDTVVLGILGDMITGYIHDELIESNHYSPTEATLFVCDLLRSGIEYIKKETGVSKIIIPCCFGNHGRTEKQKKVSTSYKNSFEWMMYKILAKSYEGDSVVTFIVENGYHVYLDVFEKYTVRFHHGDQMRYLGGVGGLTIPVNKSVSQWNKIKVSYLDVFGHFHQFKDNGNWISNGSLIGYNSYALSIKADYERPRQAFFLIDEKRGKTFVCPIYVEDDLSY